MGVNKVALGNETLIDLSSDTVDTEHLVQGYTAHDRSGTAIIGTAPASAVTGVKGAAEQSYRTGNVELDEENIGIEFLTNAEISTMFANA